MRYRLVYADSGMAVSPDGEDYATAEGSAAAFLDSMGVYVEAMDDEPENDTPDTGAANSETPPPDAPGD